MKKIVISCVFVLHAFQVNASQEGGLLGIIAFSGSIAFVLLNQQNRSIPQLEFQHENDQKNNDQKVDEAIISCVGSEILPEVEVSNENIFETQCVGLVSSNYGYDFQASISSGLHVPVWHDEDIDPLSASIVLVSHGDAPR